MTQRSRHSLTQATAAFLMLLALGVIAWWLSGPSSDTTIVYPASCRNGLQVLPPGMALDPSTPETWESTYSEYHRIREDCLILAWPRTNYKLNRDLGEVYSRGEYDVSRLVDCAILSRSDWKCFYVDGSGPIVVLGGLKALHQTDAERAPPIFYLKRWQWWFVTLYSWIGNPQGSWLIPEQVEYIGPKP
jgi:hypothetical protein